MKNAFCTIITADYLPYAKALHTSLKRFDSSAMYVLVTDLPEGDLPDSDSSFQILTNGMLLHSAKGKAMYDAHYHKENKSIYRWSMKSVLLHYLIQMKGHDKAMFLDGDLCFFSDPGFLWDKLNDAKVLLTPHWRNPKPVPSNENFDMLYNQGLFNAGFMAFSAGGIETLKWLTDACTYKCDINPAAGHFGDQTHLNLLPVYFEGVEIIRHKGCNVAHWNLDYLNRSVVNGRVVIDSSHPVVFIHFTRSTIRGILMGADSALKPFLEEYNNILKEAGGPDLIEKYQHKPVSVPVKPGLIKRVIRKLKG